ncbi:enoyl-[acyl-carrier protein] reductase II [Maribacter vaceletii]|uniref:Enoyl-[acyl-carrier protein] reductase II n=1 Tax=Maribacter vaceletii TaxID=1206816 RepID=A0A495DSA8_9FLAO|nr:nitronate monooxygenase [Maribacter vaceletii]RKR06482.1 enoyl-[acyl-carrier protein] reductase II [Maribacter vaceletii]
MKNKVLKLFGIEYPIIQGGMIWASGWRLASAVSNAGGLGVIGAGSMYPNVLREHILKCQEATNKPFAVNIPMLYPDLEEIINIVIELGVKIVITSAGNPKVWTSKLKSQGILVVHVVGSLKFALKAEEAGVDAIVAEGFEAGGHNGRDESTTLTLIPLIKKHVKIPIIAAGGIATGNAMLAVMVLGADAVQVGSRFVACKEASSHRSFKEMVVNAKEGDTKLTLKELAPVRLLNNKFYQDIQNAYKSGASVKELKELLGRARAKKGMFEGDMDEGELEIGQVSALISDIKPAKEIIEDMMQQFNETKSKVSKY